MKDKESVTPLDVRDAFLMSEESAESDDENGFDAPELVLKLSFTPDGGIRMLSDITADVSAEGKDEAGNYAPIKERKEKSS